MIYTKQFSRIFRQIKVPFFLSLIVYIGSLLFNTSFHIMGVNIANQISTLVDQEYILYILYVNLKVFTTYLALFANIYFLIEFIVSKLKIRKQFSIFFFLLILVIVFFHTIVLYPQLYGELFYVRHSYLQPLLYFLTDHTTPQFFEVVTYSVFACIAIFLIFFFWEDKELGSFLMLIAGLLFVFFHNQNILIGIVFTFILMLYAQNQKSKTSLSLLALPLLVVVLWILDPTYYSPKHSKLDKLKSPNNLILVSADSLRPDKIGQKRNGKSITPNIDQFAKEAIRFQDHHVTIPRTFPSWADLLTGEYSMSHKIRHMFPAPEEVQNLGNLKFQTIGHYLQKQGFQTAVFSNFAGDIFPRADFGFEFIQAPKFNAKVLIVQRNLESHAILLAFLSGVFFGGGKYFSELDDFSSLGDPNRLSKGIFSFLDANKTKPIFLTIFHSVTHFPYSPPYPYYKKYTDPGYYGRYKYFKFVDPTKEGKPSKKDIEQIRTIFDGAINSVDNHFGKLVDWLKRHSLYDNSIIVITGDHGESIYEGIHGHGHGEHLRGPYVTHVPLLIKFPKDYIQENKLTQKTFAGVTSSIDLVPTLLDFYQIQTQKTFPGKSLLDALSQGDWLRERYVYAETGVWFSDIGDHFFQKQRIMYPNILKLHRVVKEHNYQIMITDPYFRETIAFAKHRAILTSDYKLIYIPTQDTVLFELYDRKKDPLNQTNLYANDFISNRLKTQLYKLVQERENATIIGDYIFPPSVK